MKNGYLPLRGRANIQGAPPFGWLHPEVITSLSKNILTVLPAVGTLLRKAQYPWRDPAFTSQTEIKDFAVDNPARTFFPDSIAIDDDGMDNTPKVHSKIAILKANFLCLLLVVLASLSETVTVNAAGPADPYY